MGPVSHVQYDSGLTAEDVLKSLHAFNCPEDVKPFRDPGDKLFKITITIEEVIE